MGLEYYTESRLILKRMHDQAGGTSIVSCVSKQRLFPFRSALAGKGDENYQFSSPSKILNCNGHCDRENETLSGVSLRNP